MLEEEEVRKGPRGRLHRVEGRSCLASESFREILASQPGSLYARLGGVDDPVENSLTSSDLRNTCF